MNLEGIFTSELHSIQELFSENKVGFYIPPYQREYSWEISHVLRIIEDACYGLEILATKSNAVTFLGSVVLVHDREYKAVYPCVSDDIPDKILLIIDGQQRLTTLLLILTILHNEIEIRRAHVLRYVRKNETAQWLANKTAEVLALLKKCFSSDMSYGEIQFIPKMIRSYADSWSRSTAKKKYESPLARYLYQYLQEITQDKSRIQFDYDLNSITKKDLKFHQVLEKNRNEIRKYVHYIFKGGNNDLNYDVLSLFINSNKMQSALFKNPLEYHVLNKLKDPEYQELARLLIFSKYFLERVVLVKIKTRDESYAFDMFESLNTTGAELTAFETFKPQIIRNEGIREYEGSESERYILEIEAFLESKTPRKKITETHNMIYLFTLSEIGTLVANRLSEQRNELKKLEQLSRVKQQIALRHLAYASTYVQNVLSRGPKEAKKRFFAEPDLNLDSETQICLHLLRKSKATNAVLLRFYSKYRECIYNNCLSVQKVDVLKEFSAAIKTMAAFFVLWHSSNLGKKSIRLHNIFKSFIKDNAFGRRLKNKKSVSITNLQLLLSKLLSGPKGGITSKEEWLTSFIERPIYTRSKEITRFILFLVTHDTEPDPSSPGLVSPLLHFKKGSYPLFLFNKWIDSYTVEHIAPLQLPFSGWTEELYRSEYIRDTIGNLTLLPPKIDSSIAEASWKKKRHFYRLLSASSLEDQKQIQKLTTINLRLQNTDYELLAKTKFSIHTDALSRIEGEWNARWIQKRSRRLGEILWNRLMKWLPLEEN